MVLMRPFQQADDFSAAEAACREYEFGDFCISSPHVNPCSILETLLNPGAVRPRIAEAAILWDLRRGDRKG